MGVDTTAGVDDTTTSSPELASDSSTSDAASAASSDGNPAAGTSADAASASAEILSEDGQPASFKSDSETKSVPDQAAPDPFEKRYRDTQAWAQRTHQSNLDLQRQLKELQTQFQATQQKQTEPQRQPWDEDHAEHAQFLRLVDKAEFYEELIQGENDPAELQKLHAKMQRALGDKGIETLSNWRSDVRRQERERRLNPKAFYSKLIRAESEPVVRETLQSTSQNYQQMLQARDQATKWVSGNPEIATPENIRAVLGMMEKGITFDQASAIVERDHYRSQVSNAKKMSASAEEKERLLQGNASGGINRNPNAGKKLDVQKLRKEKGIQDGRGFTDMLFELDKEGLL